MEAVNKAFMRFANKASDLTGSSWAFLLAVAIIVVWAISGPLFGFSDTWQLMINTLTTLVTFLMVFLIQNTQNRDAKALHLKMDEIIRVIGAADDELIDLDDLTDAELRDMIKSYRHLAHQAHTADTTGSAVPGRPNHDLPDPAALGERRHQRETPQDGGELVLAGTPPKGS